MRRLFVVSLLLVAACKSSHPKHKIAIPNDEIKEPQCQAVWEACACDWSCVDVRYAQPSDDCKGKCNLEGPAPEGCHAVENGCTF